jgi:hypothetical protein
VIAHTCHTTQPLSCHETSLGAESSAETDNLGQQFRFRVFILTR